MTGGCEGAASGAGIRFSKAGTCGAGDPRIPDPRRRVGLRTKPPPIANPPPCPKPPRAKPGVDPTTQAAANTAAKTRFMVVILILCRPLDTVQSSTDARLVTELLVAVASECGARRRHRRCVCSLGERRDRNQRDQRESRDEFLHDTSPSEHCPVSCNSTDRDALQSLRR